MLNHPPLAMQIPQRRRANHLGLIRQPLTGLEALRAAVETVRAGKELLALFVLCVAGGVVAVAFAVAKEGGAVFG